MRLANSPTVAYLNIYVPVCPSGRKLPAVYSRKRDPVQKCEDSRHSLECSWRSDRALHSNHDIPYSSAHFLARIHSSLLVRSRRFPSAYIGLGPGGKCTPVVGRRDHSTMRDTEIARTRSTIESKDVTKLEFCAQESRFGLMIVGQFRLLLEGRGWTEICGIQMLGRASDYLT